MVLINKVNLDLIVEQGEKLGKGLCGKSKKIKPDGLKNLPLTQDTIELSTKANAVDSLLDKLPQISAMRESGMTQDKIAEIFGVNRCVIQKLLKKYLPNISTDSIRFRKATQQFMSAVSEEEKNKAFESVDKILQKIAKEKTKLNSNYTYDDCLQDLRLQFLEIAETNKGKSRIVYEQILQGLKTERKQTPDTFTKVDLSELEKHESAIATSDMRTRQFESDDFCYQLIRQSKLSERQSMMAHSSIMEDKSINEIAERFWLTPTRVKGCLKEIFEILQLKQKEVTSNNYLHKRSIAGQNTVNEIIASSENRAHNRYYN